MSGGGGHWAPADGGGAGKESVHLSKVPLCEPSPPSPPLPHFFSESWDNRTPEHYVMAGNYPNRETEVTPGLKGVALLSQPQRCPQGPRPRSPWLSCSGTHEASVLSRGGCKHDPPDQCGLGPRHSPTKQATPCPVCTHPWGRMWAPDM